MPIVQTVEVADFVNAFHQRGRGDQFQNLEWLYDHLESYDVNIELDVIALCCEYVEDTYDGIVASSTGLDAYLPDLDDYCDLDEGGEAIPGTLDEEAYAEARREAILEYLRDNTSVCGYDDETVLYAQF